MPTLFANGIRCRAHSHGAARISCAAADARRRVPGNDAHGAAAHARAAEAAAATAARLAHARTGGERERAGRTSRKKAKGRNRQDGLGPRSSNRIGVKREDDDNDDDDVCRACHDGQADAEPAKDQGALRNQEPR